MVMKNLIAHFTNITKNVSESRPILQGVHYNKEGGFIAATDSHRLLYYKSETIPSSYVQHPLTLSFLDGHYPDVTKLLSKTGQNVLFDPKEITPTLISLLKALKDNVIEMKITNENVSFHQEYEGAFFTINLEKKGSPIENETIAFNAKYITQALQFLKEAEKYETKELIELNFSTNVRPITFRTSIYEYLITPIRRKG